MSDAFKAARETARRQYGALTAAQARSCGVWPRQVTRLLATGEWQRVVRGVFLVVDVVDDRLRALASAALLAAPRGSVCSHALAAHLWGMRGVGDPARLHVIAPPDQSRVRRERLVVHRNVLVATERAMLGGIPLTTPERTLCDLATTGSAAIAVSAADSALADRTVTPGALAAYVGSWPGPVRRTLALADGLSESPLESRVRVVLVLGGLPEPELQIEFRDEGGRVYARVDLGYRKQRVGIEADGTEVHASVSAAYADRRRQNRLLADGWVILRFTWWDVVRRPGYVVAEVGRVLRARGWTPS